jgi:hypothetical protein
MFCTAVGYVYTREAGGEGPSGPSLSKLQQDKEMLSAMETHDKGEWDDAASHLKKRQ